MKPIHKLSILIIILALFGLACGLGGTAKDAIEEKAAEVADQAQQAAESIATEAAPAVEQAQQAAEELATEAAPAVEEAQQAAEDAVEQVGEAAQDTAEQVDQAAGETEQATLEIGSIDQTLANFSSYRSEIVMTFDGTDSNGQPSVGKITVSTENIKEPATVHMRMQMEGSTVEETGGFGMFEVYLVDGMTYMQNPEDGSWMSFPAGDDDTFTSGFFSADDVVQDLPKSAKRSLLPQTVNGISCWHYTFDETDFVDETDMNVEDASGEVWLARDGDYPVKMKFTISGSNVSDNPDGADFFNEGTMSFEYNLLDVNQPLDIVLPDAAKNAGGMFGGGGDTGSDTGGDSAGPGMASTADLPLPDDAEVQFSMEGMMSYTTQQSPQAVADFYKAELSDWSSEDMMEMVDETGLLLSFISPDETVNLMIAGQIEDDGSMSVSVIATEQ